MVEILSLKMKTRTNFKVFYDIKYNKQIISLKKSTISTYTTLILVEKANFKLQNKTFKTS